MTRSRNFLVALAGLVVASLVVAAFVLVRGGEAGSAPPAGLSGGVAAMTSAPLATNVPASVTRFVESAARVRATNPSDAEESLHLLRADLGVKSANLYAFRTEDGAICFLLTGYAGVCPRALTDGSPGLLWTLGGGHGDAPSVLAGIASDDVTTVDLTIDGGDVPVMLKSNVVYAEFPAMSRDGLMTIHRVDGSTTEIHVPLER